jgi:hypothetical protein
MYGLYIRALIYTKYIPVINIEYYLNRVVVAVWCGVEFYGFLSNGLNLQVV